MTDPVHPLFRSERRFAWVLQVVIVAVMVGLLIADLTGDDEPVGGPETASSVAPATSAPDVTAPSTAGSSESASTPSTAPTTAGGPSRTFTLVATGDIISHGAVAERAATSARQNGDDGWNFTPLFARIRPIIAGADLALCHLESPLSMDDDDLSFRGTFRVPSSLADAIAEAGYDGCSLASNHALDSGPSSVTATLHHMRRVGLATAGMAETSETAGPAWFTPGGIRLAHLSVTDLINGRDLPVDPPWMVPHLDVDRVIAEAAMARSEGAKFVVVSVHWGEEYRSDPTDRQQAAAERLLDSPEVDLVLGHHAHVVQPVIRSDGDAVVYGLGNFLTNQPGDEANPCGSCPPETQDGLIAWFQVTETHHGAQITDAGYVPTWVDRTATHEIVPIGIDDPDLVDPGVLVQSATRTATRVEPVLRRLTFTAG
ncbi:MAG: CapA family protein [Acidimicrobiales bacterium]|nr:CapA family protein [Acidimicrobiales bacterium]